MSTIATDTHLAELVSDLSEAFRIFSNEAANLNAILGRSDAAFSENKCDLRNQCIAEVRAFEEYLNRKEEILEYLNVESRQV